MEAGTNAKVFLRQSSPFSAVTQIRTEPPCDLHVHHASSRWASRAAFVGHSDRYLPPLTSSKPQLARDAMACLTAWSPKMGASSDGIRAIGSLSRSKARIARWTAKFLRDSPRLGSGCIGRSAFRCQAGGRYRDAPAALNLGRGEASAESGPFGLILKLTHYPSQATFPVSAGIGASSKCRPRLTGRPSSSHRVTRLRSWKKATIPGGIGSQKATRR